MYSRIIATPGRLVHLISEMEYNLKTVEYVGFDEADRLFEMGFADQLHQLLRRLPDSRQTCLFSATLPKILVEFAKVGLTEPELIRLDTDVKISEDLQVGQFDLFWEHHRLSDLLLGHCCFFSYNSLDDIFFH
jgi:ATP-dependent RNA helicase DDX54/DBP10